MTDSRKSITDRNSIYAAAATVAIVILLFAWMLTAHFRISLETLNERVWPPVDSSEIVFGGEFVKLGDMSAPSPQQSRTRATETQNQEEPSHEGTSLENAGAQSAEVPDMATSGQPSPAKIEKKEKPQKAGPTKEELAERERIRQEREQAQKSKRINSGIKNTFNKPGKSNNGTTGSQQGNSTQGATSGSPGYSLEGRTPQGWGRPSSPHGGTITIKVKVNRQGYVTEATYDSGKGPAAAQASVRNSCIQAARQSRFSVDMNAKAEQTGYITWTFR